MINRLIKNDIINHLSNTNLVISKTECKIEVYINKPIFDDIGTYIYKSLKDTDTDYNEIIELITK